MGAKDAVPGRVGLRQSVLCGRDSCIGSSFLWHNWQHQSGNGFGNGNDDHSDFSVTGLVAAGIVWLCRITRPESGLELCWLLCIVGMAGVFLSTVVLDITLRGIYVFMWFPLIGFSALILLEKLPGKLKPWLAVLVCVVSLVSLRSCYIYDLPTILHGKSTDSSQMCQWALDNGYEYVYGDYWNVAPNIAAFSEGDLEAGCWHTPKHVFLVEKSNTPQDIYGPTENAKAIYVFTASDVEAGLLTARKQGITLEKVAEFGDYQAYTSPVPLMRTDWNP